jgi:hypothetical protein
VYLPDPADLLLGCERAQLDQTISPRATASTEVLLPPRVDAQSLRLRLRCDACSSR